MYADFFKNKVWEFLMAIQLATSASELHQTCDYLASQIRNARNLRERIRELNRLSPSDLLALVIVAQVLETPLWRNYIIDGSERLERIARSKNGKEVPSLKQAMAWADDVELDKNWFGIALPKIWQLMLALCQFVPEWAKETGLPIKMKRMSLQGGWLLFAAIQHPKFERLRQIDVSNKAQMEHLVKYDPQNIVGDLMVAVNMRLDEFPALGRFLERLTAENFARYWKEVRPLSGYFVMAIELVPCDIADEIGLGRKLGVWDVSRRKLSDGTDDDDDDQMYYWSA